MHQQICSGFMTQGTELFCLKISLNFSKGHQRKKLPTHFNVHQRKGFRNVTKVANRVPTDGVITQDNFKYTDSFQVYPIFATKFYKSNENKCIIFFPGDDRDSTGSLLSIDSQEGVVKLDQNGDVKMLQLKYLCKLKDDM